MPSIHPTLNILVALSCEAKPLIDYYRLTKYQNTAYSHFYSSANEHCRFNINLVVTGIGLLNMAAACGWLGALSASGATAWLNIGIAGHQSLSVGEIIRVVCSISSDEGRSHYPPLVAKWRGETVSVLSKNKPCTNYPDEFAVDMEASGFFMVAKKFASSELVQSLKIISDNQGQGIEGVNLERTSNLIKVRVLQIDSFAQGLIELVPDHIELVKLAPEIRHLHCTASQLLQYQDLLNKLSNMSVSNTVLSEKFAEANSIKALLRELRSLLAKTTPMLLITPSA